MPIKNKLDHSRPFDRWRISDHKNVKQVEAIVLEKIKTKGITFADKPKFRKHLRMLLLDLMVSYLFDPKQYIAISRDKNKYIEGTRYNALYMSYRYTIAALESLVKFKFIEQHKGFNDAVSGKSRVTRIKAKPNLIELFKDHKLKKYMVKRIPDTKLIYLKDENGNDLNYDDSGFTISCRDNLQKINSMLSESYIDLRITDTLYRELLRDLAERNEKEKKRWRPKKGKEISFRLTTVDFSRNQLKRIFTDGAWDKGGRFYSVWWQSIPSKYRKYIRINERSTVELDYKQMHPTMLYALCGNELVEDPYTLKGFDEKSRGDLKVVLNTMINAADPISAKKSLQYGMPKASLPDGYDSLDDVFDAFVDKHKVIVDYFFTDYGKTLQYFDSIIAEDVMLVLHRLGVVCLPVHDSFIVDFRYEQVLRAAMDVVFKYHVGQIAQIKKDKTIYDVMKRKAELDMQGEIKSLQQIKLDNETGEGKYSMYHQRKAEWYFP